MPVRVKPVTVWRAEVDNQPGALARILEPLAAAGVNLQAVMGYRLPGDRARAAIEVFPVTGAKPLTAAQASGFSEATIHALHIEGDNRAGLGHAVAKALADDGINMDFFLALTSGARHTTVIGFDSGGDADRAAPLIKRAAAPRKAAGRRPASTGARRAPRRRARQAARRRR